MQRDRDLPLLHSPNGCHSQCWARLKKEAGARRFLHVSTWVTGSQTLAIVCCFSQAINTVLDWKWRSLDLNGNHRMLVLQPYQLHHNAGPQKHILNREGSSSTCWYHSHRMFLGKVSVGQEIVHSRIILALFLFQ